jgi:hypothetical protein
MPHIIKKQVIELNLDKRVDCFYIQELISRQYWKEIVPDLQRIFDKMGNGEFTIEVDKLVIDLGVFTEKSIIQNDWLKGLSAKLEESFEGLKTPAASGLKIIHKPKQLSVFRQWLFYMQHGFLNWNTIRVDDQWYQGVLEALATDHESVRELRELMIKDLKVVKRIALHHKKSFFINLIETLTAQKQDELIAVILKLDIAIESVKGSAGTKMKTLYREILFNLRFEILRAVASEPKLSPGHPRSIIKEYLMARKLSSAMLLKVAVALSTDRDLSGIAASGQRKEIESEVMNLSAPHTKTIINEEGIYVNNAGMVILHPFIHNFFKRLDLVSEGKFIDRYARQKAVYLLNYLATGYTGAEEHELVIAKILCAWPFQETIEPEIRFSKKEQDEALNLLMAAIIQWGILKNTSATGLREGFLQRNGKLFTREDNLYLQIETSSIDMLLDHLPWSFGMVKLPWMDGILRVEWR